MSLYGEGKEKREENEILCEDGTGIPSITSINNHLDPENLKLMSDASGIPIENLKDIYSVILFDDAGNDLSQFASAFQDNESVIQDTTNINDTHPIGMVYSKDGGYNIKETDIDGFFTTSIASSSSNEPSPMTQGICTDVVVNPTCDSSNISDHTHHDYISNDDISGLLLHDFASFEQQQQQQQQHTPLNGNSNYGKKNNGMKKSESKSIPKRQMQHQSSSSQRKLLVPIRPLIHEWSDPFRMMQQQPIAPIPIATTASTNNRGRKRGRRPRKETTSAEDIENSFRLLEQINNETKKICVANNVDSNRKWFEMVRMRHSIAMGIQLTNDASHICNSICKDNNYIIRINSKDNIYGCIKYGTIHYCDSNDISRCPYLQSTSDGIVCLISGLFKATNVILSDTNVINNEAWHLSEKESISASICTMNQQHPAIFDYKNSAMIAAGLNIDGIDSIPKSHYHNTPLGTRQSNGNGVLASSARRDMRQSISRLKKNDKHITRQLPFMKGKCQIDRNGGDSRSAAMPYEDKSNNGWCLSGDPMFENKKALSPQGDDSILSGCNKGVLRVTKSKKRKAHDGNLNEEHSNPSTSDDNKLVRHNNDGSSTNGKRRYNNNNGGDHKPENDGDDGHRTLYESDAIGGNGKNASSHHKRKHIIERPVANYLNDILWYPKPREMCNMYTKELTIRRFKDSVTKMIRCYVSKHKNFPMRLEISSMLFEIKNELRDIPIIKKCIICEEHYSNIINRAWTRMEDEHKNESSIKGLRITQGSYRNFALAMLYIMADGLKVDGKDVIEKDPWLNMILPPIDKLNNFSSPPEGKVKMYKCSFVTKGNKHLKDFIEYMCNAHGINEFRKIVYGHLMPQHKIPMQQNNNCTNKDKDGNCSIKNNIDSLHCDAIDQMTKHMMDHVHDYNTQ